MVTIMNLNIYCFYRPECEGNIFSLWVTSQLAVTCLSPINPVKSLLMEVPREKNMDLKSMQENISKSVTRLTKSVVGIRTD